MLQFNPDTYWSLWHLLGVAITGTLVLYWLVLKRKWVGYEKIEGDVLPLNIVRRYLFVIAIPLIGGGLLDVFANIIAYPNLVEQILLRGLTYYVILLFGFVWIYLVFIATNWFMKDPWNDSTDSVNSEKET